MERNKSQIINLMFTLDKLSIEWSSGLFDNKQNPPLKITYFD